MKYRFLAAAMIAAAAFALWYVSTLKYSSSRIVAECSAASVAYKALCYTQHMNDVLSRRGLVAALDLMAYSYVHDADFKGFCHANAHDLGRAAYDLLERTGKLDLTTEASYCGFGFYHGVMEQMFAETGSLDQARDFCAHVGAVLGGNQRYAEGACYHGIGHGVTDGTDPRAWGDPLAMATPGLMLCREVAQTDEFKIRCASGVFNSMAILYQYPKYRLEPRDDPYSLCRTSSFNEDERKACYDQMNLLVIHTVSHDDFKMALKYTSAISDTLYRQIAINGVATLAFSRGKNADYERSAVSACEELSAADGSTCLSGLVNSMVEFGTPGEELAEGKTFCDTVVTERDRPRCYQTLVTYAQGIKDLATQKALCTDITEIDRPGTCASVLGSESSKI